jgi:saccharopine dehydrogenase-like NADP-dependent oxidoreductase
VRVLLVGAGGVGSAFTAIAARRDFFETCVVADYDVERAEKAVAALSDDRFVAARVDAAAAGSVERLALEHRATHVLWPPPSSIIRGLSRPETPCRLA